MNIFLLNSSCPSNILVNKSSNEDSVVKVHNSCVLTHSLRIYQTPNFLRSLEEISGSGGYNSLFASYNSLPKSVAI